jgi:TRAP transporter 4TM/12TM fusion protein
LASAASLMHNVNESAKLAEISSPESRGVRRGWLIDVFERASTTLTTVIAASLCLFTVIFVNFNVLQPQSALAIFTLLGMVLCFLTTPAFKFLRTQPALADLEEADSHNRNLWLKRIDLAFRWMAAGLCVVCFGYLFVQSEPVFSRFWSESQTFSRPVSLGERSGDETLTDYWIGVLGLIVVLEGARRTIGWIVPALSILFMLHAYFAPELPDWLLPHPGRTPKQIVSATFLQSLGVLGQAISVMFKFVFLFVIFGAFLEMSGATQFIIDFSRKLFHKSAGGPAKISVISSGLMGSLSGSAVANVVSTGTFTIPMMKSAGFKPHQAAAVEAAAGTGGAMVPPVMGAAAYMMLELVENITFVQIIKAAIIPAVLYYLSLYLVVHFQAKKNLNSLKSETEIAPASIAVYEGVVFFGALGLLLALLFYGLSPFKAVSGSLILILVLTLFRRQLLLGISPRLGALLAFAVVVLIHQLSGQWASASVMQNPLMRPFLATSWIHPDGYFSFRLALESLLNSMIFGAIGLWIFGLVHPAWRPQMVKALRGAAVNGIPLIAASACVGIIIGIVQTTPVANDFSAVIRGLIESNLLLALIGIMGCSLVLGMGVPSVVCYLLMATMMGSLLKELGVQPIAAHMFILYYGMMSMVTPPVALAAYAGASIAEAPIMKTAMTAFNYSLVGFALPFMFIYQPALLLLPAPGEKLIWYHVVISTVLAVAGVFALSAAVVGYMRRQLSWISRLLLAIAAILLLYPAINSTAVDIAINGAGFLLLALIYRDVLRDSRSGNEQARRLSQEAESLAKRD